MKDRDPAFVASLVPKLKSMHLLSGEYVYRVEEDAEEIYFIVRGRVLLQTKEGLVFKTYVEGSYFGETDILAESGRKRICSVQVAPGNDCELLLLGKKEFLDLMDEYPQVAREIKYTSKMRDKRNQISID